MDSEGVYYIKIKKEYASAVIEDLQQADAIEIVTDTIPEWQQKETLRRLQEMHMQPENTLTHEEFLKLSDIDE